MTKALTKDREARYQTIKEVESDLRSLKQRLMFQEEFDRSAEIHDGAKGTAHAATRKQRLPKAINSLAVLPLINESADPNTEYLSDGITESIINKLSQLPNLRVMSDHQKSIN